MIRPLRKTHFAVWLILVFLAGAVIAVSLTARTPTTPVNPGFIAEEFE